MKKLALLIPCLLIFQYSISQERVITTGVPFLLVAADARAAGLGDQGVATSPDAYSQQWNPSKYAFINKASGFHLSYTPYLTSLVNDISLGQFGYYGRINEKSAFAASLRYFALGEIVLTDLNGTVLNTINPNEFALDGSYTLKLSEKFSFGVGGRFINSNFKIPSVDNSTSAARTFAVDISGFFQGEETAYNDFNGRLRLGFNFQNLGPKINYDNSNVADKTSNFLPANMKLGGGYDFGFDEYSKLSVSLEVGKLLVPTPQIPVPIDSDGNGIISPTEINDANAKTIEEYRSINWSSGIFKSFNDAPGGISEELRELTYSVGTEYNYQDSFAVRLGYFSEDKNKGARNFFSLGAGFKYTSIKIDVSYLFNASKIKSPLENTLRFSLSIGLGDDYDDN